jgi:TRAP-type C4-dicarboxylate transport system substrate-binding protein
MGKDEGTKAGGTGGPVTLRIGTFDLDGTPAGDQIEDFARRVERLSGGELRIEPVWRAADAGSDWDQRVARSVMSGELEMGLIPTRAWDTEGVTSLRVLNAPFLITSDDLLAEVVSGGLAEEMLSGLEGAGVVGLALFPEGLHHPFGYRKPLLGPRHYAGETIRAPTSATIAALFDALGATTTDKAPNARTQAGTVSSYLRESGATAMGNVPATGNVTFYPKANALVVGHDVFQGLDTEQRQLLERAAAGTREWAIRSIPGDAQAAQAHCEKGAGVVLASKADLVALEQAAAPVYAELESDEQTRRLIERIRVLKRGLAAPAIAHEPCGAVEVRPVPKAVNRPDSELDGVYRFEVTDQALRAQGLTDEGLIADAHGVITYSMQGGEYCWRQRAPNELSNPEECGSYRVVADRLVFDGDIRPAVIYRWRMASGGDLELSVLQGSGPVDLMIERAFASNTWRRIGDP